MDELINDFGLQKCQNTYVGGKFVKGISGGEKKRVCIAVEVVTKPDLLILDEPTSGLDSYMANNVIKVFNRLAKKEGKTIVFTIHQPSYKIFTELDRLILLDKGEVIYQGMSSAIFRTGFGHPGVHAVAGHHGASQDHGLRLLHVRNIRI